MSMVEEFRRFVAPLRRKVNLMVARAIVELVSDGHGVQEMQLTVNAGDLWDNVQRFQQFGFTSTPVPGAEACVVAVGGSRMNGIVISTEDRRYRLAGVPGGGVALYDAGGATIVLSNDGKVTVTAPEVVIAAGTKVHMDTPLLEVTGDIVDNSGSNARSIAGMRTVYDGHMHNDAQGGVTGGPNQAM